MRLTVTVNLHMLHIPSPVKALNPFQREKKTSVSHLEERSELPGLKFIQMWLQSSSIAHPNLKSLG